MLDDDDDITYKTYIKSIKADRAQYDFSTTVHLWNVLYIKNFLKILHIFDNLTEKLQVIKPIPLRLSVKSIIFLKIQ
jgi:hypothetical protein